MVPSTNPHLFYSTPLVWPKVQDFWIEGGLERGPTEY